MEIVTINENRYRADQLAQMANEIASLPRQGRPVFGFAVSSYGGCRTETERLQGVSVEFAASSHLHDTATAAMSAIVRARGANVDEDLEDTFRGCLTSEELERITVPTCANCGAPVVLATDHYYTNGNQELVAGCTTI